MTEAAQTFSASSESVASVVEACIKDGQLEVPMLPKVTGRVVALSNDPDSDASQLAKLIQSDQSLAGHVMRIANSAAYSSQSSMVSLQQAITRLGMNLISEIALSASIGAKMLNTPGFETHVDEIWRHALATALWSKEIARIIRRNVEATFLCGLLHSIGRPVTLQYVVEIASDQGVSMSREQVLELEDRYQQRVGTVVANRWEMPAVVCEAIRHFGDYKNASQGQEQCKIVCAAAEFATHMLFPDRLTDEMLVTLPVLADLNLYQDEVKQLLDLKEGVTDTMQTMAK